MSDVIKLPTRITIERQAQPVATRAQAELYLDMCIHYMEEDASYSKQELSEHESIIHDFIDRLFQDIEGGIV